MSPLWIVLTASALALAMSGWVPRPLRPAPTFVAAVFVLVSGAVSVSVLRMFTPPAPSELTPVAGLLAESKSIGPAKDEPLGHRR